LSSNINHVFYLSLLLYFVFILLYCLYFLMCAIKVFSNRCARSNRCTRPVALLRVVGRKVAAPSPIVALHFVLSGALAEGSICAVHAPLSFILDREAFGLGDVNLAAAAGIWLGLAALPTLVFIASTITLLALPVRTALRRHAGTHGGADRKSPFGPGLWFAAAAIVAPPTDGLLRYRRAPPKPHGACA
jgi:prepilin signal peptidase PulO-like enzyme (type II secretory pathway)